MFALNLKISYGPPDGEQIPITLTIEGGPSKTYSLPECLGLEVMRAAASGGNDASEQHRWLASNTVVRSLVADLVMSTKDMVYTREGVGFHRVECFPSTVFDGQGEPLDETPGQ